MSELLEVTIQRGNVCLVLFPRAIVHESLLVHIFFQQTIVIVMVNPCAYLDIFASLTAAACRYADADESENDKKNPRSHFIWTS